MNGNGNGVGWTGKHLTIGAMSVVALAGTAGNSFHAITNPVGERVAKIENQLVNIDGQLRSLEAKSEQRANLFADVGEIKADMRWVRQAIDEIKGKMP